MVESFLNGRVVLHAGDMLAVLPTLQENSIDACCVDPPYHLQSIHKRFAAKGRDETSERYAAGPYGRHATGFMGKQWDGGGVAFDPATWAKVYRVLKPGAHLLAFGGTRTSHRMACAIEDAGFEIRDQVGWCYGSGFPKSHDVSKGIDRHGGKQVSWFGPWLKSWREQNGIKQSHIAALFPSKGGGKTGCVANWELGFNLPTPEQFNAICQRFGLPFESLEAAEREIIGSRRSQGGLKGSGEFGVAISNRNREIAITAPATAAARQWEGWGTALKPAMELICVARKPLSEPTIAANVVKWGTGALNIDGCRVDAAIQTGWNGKSGGGSTWDEDNCGLRKNSDARPVDGRWPANIIHDGSEEVLAGFPESKSSPTNAVTEVSKQNTIGLGINNGPRSGSNFSDFGSAARFFYTAKADSDDRLGSKHPTVKPLDLMQYLVRLVTPPGGLVLDPFAGTGTTGEATFREGFRAILIEREAEYQADIRRRMALVLAGPDERAREGIKERMKDKPRDDGPLFNSPPNKGGGKYADGRSKSKYFVAIDPKVAE